MRRLLLLTISLASACGYDWDILSDAPIPVSLIDPEWHEGEDNSFEVGVTAAIDGWNEAAQGELFVYEGRDTKVRDGRINVTIGVELPDPQNGIMLPIYYDGDHTRLRRIEIRTEHPILNTLMHELGHAIGLDHDADEASVMHSPGGLTVAADDAEYAGKVARGERVHPEFRKAAFE